MVIEYVRYRIAAERHAEFLAAYRAASAHLAAAPECVSYEIAQGMEEPDRFVVRLTWSSIEAHERGFRGGPHFPPFLALVRPFLAQIEEMKHYQAAHAGAARGEAS